jgi:iron complex transport system ATP-binding protein
VIAFRDAVVRYPGAKVDAVHGVSLAAARAQLTAVVGPNGSGKSTLVRALIGRVPLVSGTIVLDDASVTQLSGDERARRIAVVSQREDLAFPTLVSEYVALGRFPHLGVWRAAGPEDGRAIESATTAAGVGELGDRRIDTLSGGEWQRVRLARALAQSAEALVLDEPTAFLDVAHEMAVFELLHRVARSGQAVLLVSHQLNLVARFADHLVLLHGGRIAAAGSPDDVMRAEILEPVYEWPLVVTRDPAVGAPALVPLRGRTGARGRTGNDHTNR